MKKKLKYLTLSFILLSCHAFGQVTAYAGPDLEICIQDTLKVIGTGLPSGDTGSYEWTRLSSQAVLATDAELKIKVTSGLTDQFQLKVTRIKNGVTYIGLDTFELKVNQLPTISFKAIPPMCYSSCPLLLTKTSLAKGTAGYNPMISSENLVYYQMRQNSYVTGDTIDGYVYDFCKFLSNDNVPKSGLRDTVCASYTDPKGCYNTGCRSVRVNPNPVVELKPAEMCDQDFIYILDNMVVKPFIKTGGIGAFRCLSVPQFSNLDKSALISGLPTFPVTYSFSIGTMGDTSNQGDYQIEYCFKDGLSGCETCDTSTLTVVKLPVPKLGPIPKQCVNFDQLNLDTMAKNLRNGLIMNDAEWKCIEFNGSRDLTNPTTANKILNSVKNNSFDPKFGPGIYTLQMTDYSTGCLVKDSIEVLVNGLPLIQIDVPDTVCSSDPEFELLSLVGIPGKWSGFGVKNESHFDPGSSPKFMLFESFTLKYSHTNPLTTCTSVDSQLITVQSAPSFDIQAVVTRIFGQHCLRLKLMNKVFCDTVNSKILWRISDGRTYSHWNPGDIFFTDTGIFKVYARVYHPSCSVVDSVDFLVDYKATGLQAVTSELMVYPNPAQNTLIILGNLHGTLTICDLSGRNLLERSINGTDHELDVSFLSAGLYVLNYTGVDGQVALRHFAKQ